MNRRHGPYRTIVAIACLSLVLAATAQAAPWWMRGATPEQEQQGFLPPDAAFRVGAFIQGGQIHVRWVIADGYYLYRDRIQVRAESPDLLLATPALPVGTIKSDPYFGIQPVYFHGVEALVGFTRLDYGAHPVQILVVYQGCAVAGLCYPPLMKVIYPDVLDAQQSAAPSKPGGPSAWELLAIGVGLAAFLLAGLIERRGRRLPTPAP